jgi:hypothetical protein
MAAIIEDNTNPPSVTRSRKNAQKKLNDARTDLEWAEKMGMTQKAPNY